MTALAEDTRRDMEVGHPPRIARFAVLTATTIYRGSAVCAETASGYARPVAASLTNPEFYGFAIDGVANPGASGAEHVEVVQEGVLVVDAITGATGVADIGDVVYMADDGTGLTETSTNNVAIGKIVDYIGGKFRVFFQATALRSI